MEINRYTLFNDKQWLAPVLMGNSLMLINMGLTLLFQERNAPILFEKHYLDETVSAILDEVSVPKYQRGKDNG